MCDGPPASQIKMQFLTFGGIARLRSAHGPEPEPLIEPQPEKAQGTDSKDLAAARDRDTAAGSDSKTSDNPLLKG